MSNKSSENVFPPFRPVFEGLQLRYPRKIVGHEQPTHNDPFSAKKNKVAYWTELCRVDPLKGFNWFNSITLLLSRSYLQLNSRSFKKCLL